MRQNNETEERKIALRDELRQMIGDALADAVRAGAAQEKRRLSHNCRERVERLLYAREGILLLIASLEEQLAVQDEAEAPKARMQVEGREEKVIRLVPGGDALGFYSEADAVRRQLVRNRLALKRIDRAVKALEKDPYYALLELKYTDGLPEEEIAYRMHCDPSTVRRNKNRLLGRLSVIFFGVDALESA